MSGADLLIWEAQATRKRISFRNGMDAASSGKKPQGTSGAQISKPIPFNHYGKPE